VVDISLTAPRGFFPRFGKFSIREQLLLEIVLISIIAFAAAFFAVWQLHRTSALLASVRDSIRPAKSAQQLARELEHIYGLSEAYQLSFSQPEQRPAISAEIEQSKSRLEQYQQEANYRDQGFTAAMSSFLGSVALLRDSADKFKSLFDERNKLSEEERRTATDATDRFRHHANNQTNLERYKRLNEIVSQIQNIHNALMMISNQRQFQIPKAYEDSVQQKLEQVAAGEPQKMDLLVQAHKELMEMFRRQLESSFEEFNSARTLLIAALENPNGLSDEETADLRSAINKFGELFGDPQQQSSSPPTVSANALSRGERMIWFRLNVMAQHVLVAQLETKLDDFVKRTAQHLEMVEHEAKAAYRQARSAALVGLLAGVGLMIVVVFVIDHNILRRLNGITQRMRALARGEAIRVTGTESHDELGEMARALQVFWEAELERRDLQHKLELANRELQHEVDESINVAQRIQSGLLLDALPAGPGLADHALLSKPCRLLGGDCYWLERFDDGYVVALIDCTGHGVPGAMMTIVTSIYLNAILHQEGHCDPATILLRLAEKVQTSLAKQTEDTSFDAGFDAAICIVDLQAQRLRYAGGGIPLLVLDGNSGDVQTVKGAGPGIDRSTIGAGPRPVTRELELRPGLRFYLASDGLVTQPDNPFGVGFGWSRLTRLLRETRRLSIGEQNERVWASFREFSANTEQRDDVTLVGFAV
jgi:serine phosphatase RsbU (regulator of sigma subunit)